MTHAAPSTLDEALFSQPAPQSKTAQFVAAILRRGQPAASQPLSARDRYLEAATDHADAERRAKAWDAHEQAALSRMSIGLF